MTETPEQTGTSPIKLNPHPESETPAIESKKPDLNPERKTAPGDQLVPTFDAAVLEGKNRRESEALLDQFVYGELDTVPTEPLSSLYRLPDGSHPQGSAHRTAVTLASVNRGRYGSDKPRSHIKATPKVKPTPEPVQVVTEQSPLITSQGSGGTVEPTKPPNSRWRGPLVDFLTGLLGGR